MALRLRRRRNLEPLAPAAPPADGAAPCLDPYSRAWPREPVAGRWVDWASATHYAGFGRGFTGVWSAEDPLTPLERFEIGDDGMQVANLLLRRLELLPRLAARVLPGARLVADAGEGVLLLAEERAEPGWHVHAGVLDTAWFLHDFGTGGVPEIPRTPPGSATLGDALDRAQVAWGPLDWQAVPSGVPRGLLETAGWALRS